MTGILVIFGLLIVLFLTVAVFIVWKADDQIQRDTTLRAEDYNPDM